MSLVAVVEVREEANYRIARCYDFSRGREYLDVTRRMRPAVEREFEIARGVLDHVRFGEGNRWQFERLFIHFGLVGRELSSCSLAQWRS
jgi:hypothetical protein